MEIIRLTKGNYQRNGVAGEGFFSALMEWKENGIKKHFKNFLITFTEGNEAHSNCRVVDLNNPEESWRGDEFAYALNRFFAGAKITDIYKYITTN